ncbi:MBL fold metallo-hydrolase [bacterium]|nr:MBL fold metallo-hydrolase [bacterium]
MTNFEVLPNIYCIDLDQKMTGFRSFINSWVYKTNELVFLVDPGPKHTIEVLIEALKKIGIQKIDYILLTHIHIDHAGAAGRLSREYPEAVVICHPKGIEHMINPEKLWKGSLKVLGEIAESYGEIIPVDPEKIIFKESIETSSGIINAVETPGHAIHHLSFHFNEYLFAGEVAGVHYRQPGFTYTRPATPPQFKLEISIDSLDKAIRLGPEIIFFGHYGFRTDAMDAMKEARSQLLLWVEVVKDQMSRGEDTIDQRIVNELLERDLAFSNLKLLDEDIQQRENYFVGNSINGIKEYVLRIAKPE